MTRYTTKAPTMPRKSTYATIGSVSEGTLRSEDLINTFAWELCQYRNTLHITREQRKRFTALLDEANEFGLDVEAQETYDASELVEELFRALEELAPPYAYFGTLEGDGANFGFWPYLADDTP
jgi:hypothetical protein